MKLSEAQVNALVVAVSERYDGDLMQRYTPDQLYRALVRDAKAQDPPYLPREPAALYEIARRNNWPSVTA